MIVPRGFPQPPSFHEQRLRDAPVGHFVDVITNGYGVMYSYALARRAGGSLGHRRLYPRVAIESARGAGRCRRGGSAQTGDRTPMIHLLRFIAGRHVR